MPEEFERPGRDIATVPDVQGEGTGTRERARAAGRDLLDRAVEKKDELKQRASTLADERRTGVAERASSISRALHGAADTLRDNGEPQLSDWVHQAAGRVERVVGYLEGKRADGMARDLENLARSNPGLFLGGTYVAGLALGRFLRATTPEHREERAYREQLGRGSEFEGGGAGAGAVTGNLGSTGWSGVGVAPGAFGSPGEERTSLGPSRSGLEEGAGTDETMRGAGLGSDRDEFGMPSDRDESEAPHDFRASGRGGLGSSAMGSGGMGSGGVSSEPRRGMRNRPEQPREGGESMRERQLDSDRDREV